jgi:hypothetical protein
MTYLQRKFNCVKSVKENNKMADITKFMLSFAFDVAVTRATLNRHVKVRRRMMNAASDVWC